MKLSDVMSAADLAIYAELGLVLFLAAFVAVAIRVLIPRKGDDYELCGQIPLSDEPVQVRSASPGRIPSHRHSAEDAS
jgi:hypothetical protein